MRIGGDEHLVKFAGFFVLGMFAAVIAVLSHQQFFRRVYFVTNRDIVLAFANRTNEP